MLVIFEFIILFRGFSSTEVSLKSSLAYREFKTRLGTFQLFLKSISSFLDLGPSARSFNVGIKYYREKQALIYIKVPSRLIFI